MSHVKNIARCDMARAARTSVAIACWLCGLAAPAASIDRPGAEPAEASLLYLEGSDWLRQSERQKIALVADFMRIFCVDPTMSASRLEECLDQNLVQGPIFEQAIACASALAGR